MGRHSSQENSQGEGVEESGWRGCEVRGWKRPAEVEGPHRVHCGQREAVGRFHHWRLWELKDVVKEKARI